MDNKLYFQSRAMFQPKGALPVRVDGTLKARIKLAARRSNMSVSEWVRTALTRAVILDEKRSK